MELTKLGWNADLSRQFAPHHTNGLVPARVAVEDKHFFRVWTADAELLAQVSGKCIHQARRSNSKLPKVGDWVAVKLVPNEEGPYSGYPSTTHPTLPQDGRPWRHRANPCDEYRHWIESTFSSVHCNFMSR